MRFKGGENYERQSPNNSRIALPAVKTKIFDLQIGTDSLVQFLQEKSEMKYPTKILAKRLSVFDKNPDLAGLNVSRPF